MIVSAITPEVSTPEDGWPKSNCSLFFFLMCSGTPKRDLTSDMLEYVFEKLSKYSNRRVSAQSLLAITVNADPPAFTVIDLRNKKKC